MTTKKKHDYSGLLIFAASVISIARYIGAFIASDIGVLEGELSTAISVLMGITGIGMGILDVIGASYIFDGWRTKMPSSGNKWSFRFKVLTFFVFSLFIVSLGILVPFTVSRVMHQSVGDVLGPTGTWLWSIAVNIAPYILIGGVVSGQTGVISVNSEVSNVTQVTGKLQETYLKDTNEVRIKVDWRTLSQEEKEIIRNCKTPKEVREKFPHYNPSAKTSANWYNNARKEKLE